MIETSIIIPARNQKSSLLMILACLKRQIRRQRVFEIVVCDDGSTDGTGDAVKKLRYPIFLKYFRNDPPVGRSINRNLGYERSSGNNMIFIDGDMVPAEGFIQAMLGDGNTAFVKLGRARVPPDERPKRLERYLYSRGHYSSESKDKFSPGRFFTSNCFFISRDNFIKVGGFDPVFKGWGGEDIDFGLRLEALNVPIKNVHDAVAYHYHKRTIKSLAGDYYDFGKNSFEYLIKKHPVFLRQARTHLLGLTDGSLKISPANRLFAFFTVNRFALKLAENVVSRLDNFAWPDLIYDYLLWGNLALGYGQRQGRA